AYPASVWGLIASALLELFASLTVAAILWYGGVQVVSQAITFGTLVAFIEYVQKFFGPIRELGGYYSVMQSAMASSERLVQGVDEPPGEDSGRRVGTTARGAIEIRDVRFSYAAGTEVLRGLTFQARPGERVALVGSTGAGKTTIARMLLRLYPVDSGSILIDGVDTREIPLADLRRRIGVVLQEPFLFAGTIAENISLG